jgi:uncharacterized protein YdbL (DUF1318 family)
MSRALMAERLRKEHGMQRLGRLTILLLVWSLIATCARITVNIYFPAAEIRDAAAQIEREVRQGEATPAEPPASEPAAPPRKPHNSWLRPRFWRVHVSLGVPEVLGQEININITTPAIRRLIAARKQRYPRLVPLFNKGILGENNRGLIDIRTLQGLSLRDQARAKALSQQENRDRQRLYRALAEANNIPPNKVTEIATIFAEVNRREARTGWWIQSPNGSWRKK